MPEAPPRKQARYLREDVLEKAVYLVAQFKPRHIIRQELNAYVKDYLGEEREMSFVTFGKILARARLMLRDKDLQSRKDMRLESKDFYLGVLADPTADLKSKLKAREALDKLYGLPMGFNVHYSGKVQVDNRTTTTHTLDQKSLDELNAMRETLARQLPAPSREPIILDQVDQTPTNPES